MNHSGCTFSFILSEFRYYRDSKMGVKNFFRDGLLNSSLISSFPLQFVILGFYWISTCWGRQLCPTGRSMWVRRSPTVGSEIGTVLAPWPPRWPRVLPPVPPTGSLRHTTPWSGHAGRRCGRLQYDDPMAIRGGSRFGSKGGGHCTLVTP